MVAVGLMLLVRSRFAPPGGHFKDSDRASGVFGFVGAGFAILLGFVVLLTFETHSGAKSKAEEEATAVFEQYEVAALFKPVAKRDAVWGELVCYARAVTESEWSASCCSTPTRTSVRSARASSPEESPPLSSPACWRSPCSPSPFQGGNGSIQPTGMRYTIELIQAEAELLHDPLATPCDAGGNPT